MKEIRIEVTEMNECPLYSFFMKDADSTRDEYEYLGCVGISFDEEEIDDFEIIVRFLLGRLINLPYNNSSYFVHYDNYSWEDEWDSYYIDIDRHVFGFGNVIEVKKRDIECGEENTTLEEFTEELGKILNLKFEVVR